MNRRDLCSLLPLLALTKSWAANGQALSSATWSFADLPVKTSEGHITRSIVKGTTPTGEKVEVHETTLDPGKMPHAAHKHAHSEFWLIREGTVELTINGRTQQVGPGSAGFAASNDLHSIKNVSSVAANYFVVEIG